MSQSGESSSSGHILAMDFGKVPSREKKQTEANSVFSTMSSASGASSTAVRTRDFRKHHQREPAFGTEIVDVTNQAVHVASAVRCKSKGQKSARTEFQLWMANTWLNIAIYDLPLLEAPQNMFMLEPRIHLWLDRYAAAAFVPTAASRKKLEKWLDWANEEWTRRVDDGDRRALRPGYPYGSSKVRIDPSDQADYELVALQPDVAQWVVSNTNGTPQVWVVQNDGLFYRDDVPLSSFKPPRRSGADNVNALFMVLKAMNTFKDFESRFEDPKLPSGLKIVFQELATLEDKIYFRPEGARSYGRSDRQNAFANYTSGKRAWKCPQQQPGISPGGDMQADEELEPGHSTLNATEDVPFSEKSSEDDSSDDNSSEDSFDTLSGFIRSVHPEMAWRL